MQNITITNEFLKEVFGDDEMSRFVMIVNISTLVQEYVIPWMAIITVITNIVVCLICCGIYTKTKRRNHKPAFLFILFLNLVDVLHGM